MRFRQLALGGVGKGALHAAGRRLRAGRRTCAAPGRRPGEADAGAPRTLRGGRIVAAVRIRRVHRHSAGAEGRAAGTRAGVVGGRGTARRTASRFARTRVAAQESRSRLRLRVSVPAATFFRQTVPTPRGTPLEQ
ncbi:hypothetical protein GCM10009602_39480 [Nocardiopsis tropica]